MPTFTTQDVENYYDQTEVHYRMFWKLDQSLGLHYGVWEKDTKNLTEAIRNTNRLLMEMGEVTPSDRVLDAGCGVGGSSIYLARQLGCRVTGITLSAKQVRTAQSFAERDGVNDLVDFQRQDYTRTDFADNFFDVVWAIESMETAADKSAFLREAHRVLKPGGRLLIADCFKTFDYDINSEKSVQTMFNGWAIADILTIGELKKLAGETGFRLLRHRDVSREIRPSVRAIYWASILGMIGTKLYNLYRRASYFSRIHYKTGLHQYRAYHKGLWSYDFVVLVKE